MLPWLPCCCHILFRYDLSQVNIFVHEGEGQMCCVQISHGTRGEVKVKLKKKEAVAWVETGRWSPEKDADSS